MSETKPAMEGYTTLGEVQLIGLYKKTEDPTAKYKIARQIYAIRQLQEIDYFMKKPLTDRQIRMILVGALGSAKPKDVNAIMAEIEKEKVVA